MITATEDASPAVVIQVDLDAVYSYKASYSGQRIQPQHDDPVYTRGLPRCLDLLSAAGLRASFFVVGQDLDCGSHREVLIRALSEGHEVASHSQHHPLGLASKTPAVIRSEIENAHVAIEKGLGVPPVGFRAPGWDISGEILQTLREAEYLYDSSVLPTWVGWIENLALKLLSSLRAPAGMGDWRIAFAPAEPYFPRLEQPWRRGSQRSIVEVPAGVLPVSRIPLRSTIQLASGEVLLRRSISWLRDRPLVYTFHGLDFLGADEIDLAGARHPNVKRSLEHKIGFCRRLMSQMASGRTTLTTAQLATRMREGHAPKRTDQGCRQTIDAKGRIGEESHGRSRP